MNYPVKTFSAEIKISNEIASERVAEIHRIFELSYQRSTTLFQGYISKAMGLGGERSYFAKAGHITRKLNNLRKVNHAQKNNSRKK